MSPEMSMNQSKQSSGNTETSSQKGKSWDNPGEFPAFMGNKMSANVSENAMDVNNRESARSKAEKSYQSELTRPYETGQDGVTRFSIEDEGRNIDGYEFDGAEFKMLVSVIGAVGQSLGQQPQNIDLEKWVNTPRDYISTSLISDKKMSLFDKNGLIFGFNNLDEGDFLSAAPADHGVLRDIGKMGQFMDQVMSPDELLEATDTRDSLTPWNEVEIDGKTKPDSIIVFGNNRDAIDDKSKEAAEFFGIPIYLIRTDVYGEPAGRHDAREVSDEVNEFWRDREKPVTGRVKQEKNALLEEVGTFFETGEVGGRVAEYLDNYKSELQAVKDNSSTKDEFIRNLITELGQDKIAEVNRHIKDGSGGQ